MTNTKNVVAYILQGVGLLIIVINLFRAINSVEWLGGQAAFEIFLQGAIYGSLLLGFGEVIRLMQGLFNQREPKIDGEISVPSGGHRALWQADEPVVSKAAKQKITDFYAKQQLEFDRLEATPYEGYVIVYRGEGREIIDLNGFKPEILSDQETKNHPDLKNL